MAFKTLNTDGFSLVRVAKSGANVVGKAGERMIHEAAMSGWGTMQESDIGRVAAKTIDMARMAQAFCAIPMKDETRYSSFAMFRDAVAAEAEKQAQGIAASQTVDAVALGDSYTGFYADLYKAQNIVADDYRTSSWYTERFSAEAKLDVANIDFNDSKQLDKYISNVQSYAQEINLRDHIGTNAADMFAGNQELLILLHTADKKAYADYIEKFETHIQESFRQEVSKMQDSVRDLGFTGNLSNVKQLEDFMNTLPDANKSTVQQLINATNGVTNKVDRYILGRIKNGDIDIQNVLATGELSGVKLSPEAMSCIAALNVYANTDSITVQYQNELLEKIGHKSHTTSLDLNNMKAVQARLAEFEKALDKAGFSSINGKRLATFKKGVRKEGISIKELRMFDLNTIADEDVRNAVRQYINLRDHQETLKVAKQLSKKLGRQAILATRKILKDSDLGSAVGQMDSYYRTGKDIVYPLGKRALKPFIKLGSKIGKAILKGVKKTKAYAYYSARLQSYYTAAKFYANKMMDGLKRFASQVSSWGKAYAKTHMSGTLERVSNAKNKINNAKTVLKNKRATRLAKRAQKNATKGAGKRASRRVRRKAKLAKKGKLGGTGAMKAIGKFGKLLDKVNVIKKKIMIYVLCFIAICIALSALCTLLAGLFQAVGESAVSLSDTVAGRIIEAIVEVWNAICDWFTGAVDENDRQDALMMAINICKRNERTDKVYLKDWLEENDYPDFYTGWYPKGETDGQFARFDQDDLFEKLNYDKDNGYIDVEYVNFIFTGMKDGEETPINPASTMRLVISMAHTWTYPIETKGDVENFLIYVEGLWKHVNSINIEARLNFCEATDLNSECGHFTYTCMAQDNSIFNWVDDSQFYDNIVDPGHCMVLTDKQKEEGVTVWNNKNNGNAKMYVVGGAVVPRKSADTTDPGCFYNQYWISDGTVRVFDKNQGNKQLDAWASDLRYDDFDDAYDEDDDNSIPNMGEYWSTRHFTEDGTWITTDTKYTDITGDQYDHWQSEGYKALQALDEDGDDIWENWDNKNAFDKHYTEHYKVNYSEYFDAPISFGRYKLNPDVMAMCAAEDCWGTGGNEDLWAMIACTWHHSGSEMFDGDTLVCKNANEETFYYYTDDWKENTNVAYITYQHDGCQNSTLSTVKDKCSVVVANIEFKKLWDTMDPERREGWMAYDKDKLDTSCASNKKTLYQCKGHDTTVYCTTSRFNVITGYTTKVVEGQTVAIMNAPSQTGVRVMNDKCCESATQITGYNEYECSFYIDDSLGGIPISDLSTLKHTWYICPGHTNHGYFDETSIFKTQCYEVVPQVAGPGLHKPHYEEKEFIICPGHITPKENKITEFVCDGHLSCGGTKYGRQHKGFCSGHTIQYCKGHVTFTFTRTINGDINDIKDITDGAHQVFNDWNYTAYEGSFGHGFWGQDKTYTTTDGPNSLKTDNWKGWDSDDARNMMGAMYDKDWYREYGVRYDWVIGSKLSKTEIREFKERCGVNTESLPEIMSKNLQIAFESVGAIPFYPGDKPKNPGMSGNDFGTPAEPFLNEVNNYQLAQHGLGHEYYAAWVHLTSHEGSSSITDIMTNVSTWNKPVTTSTSPGTPVVMKEGGKIKQSYILIGFVDGKAYCIGTSDKGWVTVHEGLDRNQLYTCAKAQN